MVHSQDRGIQLILDVYFSFRLFFLSATVTISDDSITRDQDIIPVEQQTSTAVIEDPS